MIRQSTKYGCGMYAVANACNMPNFVTPERLEASKAGNRIGQLSKWLQEDGHPFYIDVLFYDHQGGKLPSSATDIYPSGDVLALPILLNVRFTEEGLNHMVAGHLAKDKTLYLYDSLREDVITTTLPEVNNLYLHCYGLFVFEHLDGEGYIFINEQFDEMKSRDIMTQLNNKTS